MVVTAFFHASLRAPTIVLNLAKKLAIFHHSSAAALVMIERYKSSITELLPKIRDVLG
jgi:microsomal dipeptidase-like Zn-dependent dipeptidase